MRQVDDVVNGMWGLILAPLPLPLPQRISGAGMNLAVLRLAIECES